MSLLNTITFFDAADKRAPGKKDACVPAPTESMAYPSRVQPGLEHVTSSQLPILALRFASGL